MFKPRFPWFKWSRLFIPALLLILSATPTSAQLYQLFSFPWNIIYGYAENYGLLKIFDYSTFSIIFYVVFAGSLLFAMVMLFYCFPKQEYCFRPYVLNPYPPPKGV